MEHIEHVAAVEREIERFTELAGSVGDLGADVPSCHDWTVGELVTHVGEVAAFWAGLVAVGLGEEKPGYPDPPDAGAERSAWLVERLAELRERLVRTDAQLEVWTWTDDHTAGFVSRRLAHELAVHRYDLETAVAVPTPIAADLAVDGIEEILHLLSMRPSGGGSGETFHVHATDVPGEWHLTFGPDAVTVEREHAKGDLAVRGAASDLELLLYDRRPVGEVERFGDESVLERWTSVFSF